MTACVRIPFLLSVACALGFAQTYLIETVAGSQASGDGGPATSALLAYPQSAVLDAAGNLYVGEQARVRKIAPGGTITTVAGTGVLGTGGDRGPATETQLHDVMGLAIDSAGNLYLADSYNHRVRKVTREGMISTVAGDGVRGFSGDGQRAVYARLAFPRGLAVDKANNLYIVDGGNSCIRKVSPDGIITTIAGRGERPGFAGDGGDATTALLWYPMGNIAIDAAGNMYFTDTENKRIRRISADGKIATVASGFPGSAGVAIDGAGNLYVADVQHYQIEKITPSGTVSTIAGTGTWGYSGDGGPATAATLGPAGGIAANASGTVYFCDSGRVRKVAAGIITTVAGRGSSGGDNGPATSASLLRPTAVTVDSAGNLYIADTRNHRVRKVTAQGIITTLAGAEERPGFGGDNGPAVSARFNSPQGIAVDSAGNVYVADTENNRIRKIWTDGQVTTIAGDGTIGWSGDRSPATRAQLWLPRGLAVDSAGSLYIAVRGSIRKIDIKGMITTVAGTGFRGPFSGDGGLATSAQLSIPYAVAVDLNGNLYIADAESCRIRRVDSLGIIDTLAVETMGPTGVAADPAGNVFYSAGDVVRRTTPAGVTATIAGIGLEGFSGDGGPATSARLGMVYGVAADAQGNVYLADTNNDRIRRLSPVIPAQITTVRGNGQIGGTGYRLPEPLVVRVDTRAGAPAPYVTVAFAVTSGTARLSANSAATGPDGTAWIVATLGATPGEVTVTASVEGLPPARFTLTAVLKPLMTGLRSSGSGSEPVAPGSLVSIYGSGLAPGPIYTPKLGDYVDGKLPLRLRGICVQFGPALAPIAMTSPNQLLVIAPWTLTAGETPVQVVVNCGESNETRSEPAIVVVQSAAPEFFVATVRGQDNRFPVLATFADSADRVGARSLGANYRPAKPGDTITIFCNGLGLTDPPLEDGQVPSDRAAITGAITLTIGDVAVPGGNILYAGLTPGSMSGYQLVVKIPDSVPDGDLALVLTVNGYRTLADGYLTIQR